MMRVENLKIILSGVALATSGMVLGAAQSASAAVIWDWEYSGASVIGGSGTFTTTDVRSDGSFLITDITGTAEGNTITSLLAPGNLGGNDNVLRASLPQLNGNGVSFATSRESLNLFYFDAFFGYTLLSDTDTGVADLSFEAMARVNPSTALPEPGSLLGYITLGGLMLGSAVKKATN